MSNDFKSRRRFLEVVAQSGVVAGAACLGVGCSSAVGGTHTGGSVAQLGVGELMVASSGPFALGRDSGGVYAMTLICTHRSCDMSVQGAVSSAGVFCYCHGSEFDANGNPVAGPAGAPLQHYQVTIDASGTITINGDVPVAESARTPVSHAMAMGETPKPPPQA
jgi:nitrite reductase/ring-hydroxylating ferredoxin subunit